jgi:hypothetical protein
LGVSVHAAGRRASGDRALARDQVGGIGWGYREERKSVDEPAVTVEFLGLARHRAGRSELRAAGRTIGDLLCAVMARCPRLAGLVSDTGELSRHYLVSFDGERFVDDAAEPVPRGCRVLILGADPGG